MKPFRVWFVICGLFLWSADLFAQFNYATNANGITITGYTGSGGAVTISNFVTGIGYQAFFESTNLNSIMIPVSVTNIGDYAFCYCGWLSNATIGSGVTSIGVCAFKQSALTSITIPGGVTNIGSNAFWECFFLTNATICKGVTSIGNEAFECSGLTSVTIPEGVTNIGEEAFEQCGYLTSITIPSSVSTIGYFAFDQCDSLASVYFAGNAPSVDCSVLAFAPATIYYLSGTSGWSSQFACRPTVLWNPSIQTSDGRFGLKSNQFGFTISGTTNIPIMVAATADLAGGKWSPVQSCSLANGSIYFTDPAWTNYPARFYSIMFP
jgi:hypothetical protein